MQGAMGVGVSPGPYSENAEPAGAYGAGTTGKAWAGSLQEAKYPGGTGSWAGQGWTGLQAVYETRFGVCRERMVVDGDDP